MISKFKTLTTTTAIGFSLAMAGTSFAEDQTGTNAEALADGGSQGPVAQLAMAQELYAYGVENKDSMAALTAAKITSSIEAKDVERDMETKMVEGAMAEQGTGKDMPADADMMYASAKEYAGGNKALLGLIDDAMSEGARGRVGGATRTLSRLRAGHVDTYRVQYFGGRQAELAIIGDGDANLDLLITDEHGNNICWDTSWTDQIYCSWWPRWDGWFNVTVENVGHIRNSYHILTN